MFDWNDLKFFLELSRRSKLIHAAKSLRVDHTTVSRRIAALEQATGAKLFQKTERGYTLTPSGEKLLPVAEGMENAALTIQDEISGNTLSLSGVVRIGSPDGFGSFFLAPRLPSLVESHPNLEIDLVALPRYFSLSKREADLAITLARPETGRLYARKLTDYQLQLFASKDYLEKHSPIKSTKDLSNHRLIGYIDDLIFAQELRYMEVIEKNLHVRFRSTSLVAQYHAVLAGAGISVLPRFMTYGDSRFIPVLPDSVRLIRSFWLLIHEDMHDLARIRETADFVTDATRSEPDLFMET
ncbi:MAG: LysR family transcriptional regulator [Aestuariibacter sp.]|nr:LysR family transcriptional regulator [Aestuariibacter sp.]